MVRAANSVSGEAVVVVGCPLSRKAQEGALLLDSRLNALCSGTAYCDSLAQIKDWRSKAVISY